MENFPVNRANTKLFAAAFSVLLLQVMSTTQGRELIPEGAGRADFSQQRIKQLRQSAKALKKLTYQAIPTELNARDQKSVRRYNRWLRKASDQLAQLANRWEKNLEMLTRKYTADTKAKGQLMMATKEMQEMNMSFNLQYLQLQQNMQQENRQFTLMSNIMKIKHDTAKNAINNIR